MARKVGRRGNFRTGKTRPGQTRPKFKFLREIHDGRYRPPNPPPINPSTLPHSHLPLNCISLLLASFSSSFFAFCINPDPASARPRLPLSGALPNLVIVGFSQKGTPHPSSSSGAAHPNCLGHEILIHPTAATLLSDDPPGASIIPSSDFPSSTRSRTPQLTTASSPQPWLPTAPPTRSTRPHPAPPRLAETRPARASCPRRRLAGTLSSNTTRPSTSRPRSST